MAFELLSRSPIHRTEQPQQRSASVGRNGRLQRLLRHEQVGRPAPKVSTAPASQNGVVYNFQYDLESVWWIILWTFLARVAHVPGQEYALCVYVNRLENTTERQLIILSAGYLTSKRKKFHKGLRPFVPYMAGLCNDLRRAYTYREEAGQVMDPASYVEIYLIMGGFLADCVGLLNEEVPDLVCLHQEAVEAPELTYVDDVETPELTDLDDVETPELTYVDDIETPESPSIGGAPAPKRSRSDDDDGGGSGVAFKRACLDERLLLYRPPR